MSEKNRVDQRFRQLGNATLRDFGKELKAAKSLYDKTIPEEILTAIPLPSIDAIVMPTVVNKKNFLSRYEAGAAAAYTAAAADGGSTAGSDVDVNIVKVPFQFSAIEGSFADLLAFITTQVTAL